MYQSVLLFIINRSLYNILGQTYFIYDATLLLMPASRDG